MSSKIGGKFFLSYNDPYNASILFLGPRSLKYLPSGPLAEKNFPNLETCVDGSSTTIVYSLDFYTHLPFLRLQPV